MAAVIGPPSHPAPVLPHTHSREPSGGQHDHHANQDPAPQPPAPHQLPPRPMYYLQAPPPPPFLPYQWPVSFPYNPFMGFPGMGYGMMMPPFMPPPYMDPPAYVMPHPHLQPVDYRRFFQPPVHAPPMSYHQNPYQIRRVRPQHPVSGRETVNSEVQTEPTQRDPTRYNASPMTGSDSGQGTASSSPALSSSHKGSCEVEELTLPNCNGADADELKRKLEVQSEVSQSKTKPSLEMQIGQFGSSIKKHGHFNMWSVSSTESLNPVCSSSQREDVTGKERRLSVPDILLSWGAGPPQVEARGPADVALPPVEDRLASGEAEVETEKSARPDPTDLREDCVLAQAGSTQAHEDLISNGSETQAVKPAPRDKTVLMKTMNSIESIQEEENDLNPKKDTVETVAYVPFSPYQTRVRLNESVWSVESLAPFIPTSEWMLQNITAEMLKLPEASEATYEVSPKDEEPVPECNVNALTPSESPPISSIPLKAQHPTNVLAVESLTDVNEDVQDHSKDRSVSSSPTSLLPKTNTDGSSEPAVPVIPNQELSLLKEQMSDPLELKQMSVGLCMHSSPLEKAEPQKPPELHQLTAPTVDQLIVSPSKRDLVDCAVQCTELQLCPCQDTGSHARKQKAMRGDDKSEGVYVNGNGPKHPKRHNQWKHRRQGGGAKNSFY